MTASERQKKWRLANPEAARAKYAKWRANNPEKSKAARKKAHKKWRDMHREHVRKTTREQMRRWREANRDKVNERARAARKRKRLENPEIYRHADKTKRAKKRGAQGSCSLEQWMARVRFYGWKCFYCKKPLTRKTLTQDHRIPLAKGGTNFPANLVPACVHCNCSKRHSKKPIS